MTYDYDILFLGGGLNYAAAVIASRAGLNCALVEQNPSHIGGTCLHNGCIPSKMYLQAAESIRLANKPWIKGSLKLDMAKLDDAKEALLLDATKAIDKQCEKVDIIKGEGILVEAHTLEVDKKRISGKYVIIGTGSHAYVPEGILYDGQQIITSDEVLNLRTLPKKIAVYGTGAIGLEMASFFAAAGVQTELIWRHDRLLPKAHPMISKNSMKQMEELGITISSVWIASVLAFLPVATRSMGTICFFPSEKESCTPLCVVFACEMLCSGRSVIPNSSICFILFLEIIGWALGSSPSCRQINSVFTPAAAKKLAISKPMAPLPYTAIFFGSVRKLSTSSLVMICLPS